MNSSINDIAGKSPGTKEYDFERMIEEAMQKYGEVPAVQAPPI
jgi:hypothetical protein